MKRKEDWVLDQLKGHVEFMQELGITGVAPEVLSCLKKGVVPGKLKNKKEKTSLPRRKEDPVVHRTAFSSGPSLFKIGESIPPSYPNLETVRENLGDCSRCKLARGRTNIVFGSGNPKSKLVFVGEGPGADEDAQGLPFVGKAGQLLTKIIESIQLRREEVYICNVVKCRPPENRVPEKDEIAACSPFLLAQLEVIRPGIICCLGATAAQTLLKTNAYMGKLRGRFYDYNGAQLIATYHPAYLLRNPAAKRGVWEDMKKIRTLIDNEKQAGRWSG